jgi:hypothetical protein
MAKNDPPMQVYPDPDGRMMTADAFLESLSSNRERRRRRRKQSQPLKLNDFLEGS